jgi:hypothetical protein
MARQFATSLSTVPLGARRSMIRVGANWRHFDETTEQLIGEAIHFDAV